jgi:hypothetical protein
VERVITVTVFALDQSDFFFITHACVFNRFLYVFPKSFEFLVLLEKSSLDAQPPNP